MLVVSLHPRTSVVVRTPQGDVRFTYEGRGRDGGKASVRIEAPDEFAILRSELENSNHVEGTRPAALDVSNTGKAPQVAG